VDALALDALLTRSRRAVADIRVTRATARRARRAPTFRTLPTGVVILPVTERDGIACVVDGDDSRLCDAEPAADTVVGYQWSDIPAAQRCLCCAVVLSEI
jgi:hypothetical protein